MKMTHREALPIDSYLRPNYYEQFALFSEDMLERRIARYPFAEATLLAPANIKTLIAKDACHDALSEFVAKPHSWQREALASVLALVGIADSAIDAIAAVERHLFVMPPYEPLSYLNAFLPWSQTAGLSPPGLVAVMLERFDPQEHHAYCEIGAGSGYHLACLYELTGRTSKLRGYEIDEAFAAHGRRSLNAGGYDAIELIAANGLAGSLDTTFDGVFATAAGGDPVNLGRICGDVPIARYQGLRPIHPAEFNSEPPDSWLKRRYNKYEDYADDDWVRRFGCLSTGTISSGIATETDVLYEVSLVVLEDGDAPPIKRTREEREPRVVDDLLDSLR